MRRLKSANKDLLWQGPENAIWTSADHAAFIENDAYARLNLGSCEINRCSVSMVEKSAMPSTNAGRK